MTSDSQPWISAPLVALDLEGSGAQDHDHEAILEIAVIPVTAGQPDMAGAYVTLVNPDRAIPRRPWISPGLTTATLAAAPDPADIEPELTRRLNGRVIVGHNVGVDWRLLHRRHPAITPAALIDTLKLARYLKLGSSHSLATLTSQLDLVPEIEHLAAGSQPHRALWDTTAAALLLTALATRAWPHGATVADLLAIAGIDTAPSASDRKSRPAGQDTLFVGPVQALGADHFLRHTHEPPSAQ
jgi:DNA polymerase III epsilon subunit-like protein